MVSYLWGYSSELFPLVSRNVSIWYFSRAKFGSEQSFGSENKNILKIR